MPEECPGQCCVRTCCDVGCRECSGVRSCALVAWVALGSAALVAMRDAGARGGRAVAGGRMAQRRALRHLGHFGPVSSFLPHWWLRVRRSTTPPTAAGWRAAPVRGAPPSSGRVQR